MNELKEYSILYNTKYKILKSKHNKINLDTILLGDFIKFNKNDKLVLDVGTGNGALMFYASIKTNAKILGIEIQENRYLETVENIKINNLDNKLEVLLGNYLDLKVKDVSTIICNPPFFKINDETKRNIDEEKELARHEKELNFDDFIQKSSEIIKNRGSIYFIHRPDRLEEIVKTLNKYRFTLKEIKFVYPYINKNANHLLVKATKGGSFGLVVSRPFIMYKNKHELSDEAKKLYYEGV